MKAMIFSFIFFFALFDFGQGTFILKPYLLRFIFAREQIIVVFWKEGKSVAYPSTNIICFTQISWLCTPYALCTFQDVVKLTQIVVTARRAPGWDA